jgi:CRP-like cAMP-binding protein
VTNAQSGPDPFPHEEVQAALERSALAQLPERLQDQLLAQSVRAELPRGRLLDGPPLFLVLSGLIRVALQSPDGRRFAVAYPHQGDVAGLARPTSRRYPLSFETVTNCRLLRLGERAVEELLGRHA